MDEFWELENEILSPDEGQEVNDLSTQSEESYTDGIYTVKILENKINPTTKKLNYLRNENGLNYLKSHLAEVIEENVIIDFEDRGIMVHTEKLSPPSPIIYFLPIIALGLLILGPVGFILGSLVCFVGFIPFVLAIMSTGKSSDDYRNEINEEIDKGGGTYRFGGIEGVIHGLDTYFSLEIKHDDITVLDAWEIPDGLPLIVRSKIYTVGSGDDSYTTAKFYPTFNSPNNGKSVELNSMKFTGYDRKSRSIGKTCLDAIEFAEELNEIWNGGLYLHSIPQIYKLVEKPIPLTNREEKIFNKVVNGITPETKSKLREVYSEVRFLPQRA